MRAANAAFKLCAQRPPGGRSISSISARCISSDLSCLNPKCHSKQNLYPKRRLGDLLVCFLISLDAYFNNEISTSLKAGEIANGGSSALQELTNDVSVLSQSETHVCARFVQWLSKEHPELAEKLGLFVAVGI